MQEMQGNIRDVRIEAEMKEAYLAYAMSVIVGRALPDARDGFKPVHRRVLHAMFDTGNTHDKPYRKSARIVGEVIGKYHPHGDSAVYDTMVRMAQDFSLRYLLVDGQGNFGSIDGDGPAAMRYTEVRMARIAGEMMADIDKDTVDFMPNYDESLTEPVVLPSKIPNLLINGSTGIAVGMSTSIPPHNLKEVCTGAIKLIENPAITATELAQVITGPDFPTGGYICGRAAILQGYTTGKSILTVRAKMHTETNGTKKEIIVTEIPYMVSKESIIHKLVEVVKEDRVTGISNITDFSDRDGMRLAIELKRGEDENVIINQLYQFTPLQTSFSMNMIALVHKQPRLLNLRELLVAFKDHRFQVIRRRTAFLLARARERAHIIEGLKIALANIDEVVRVIKSSKDRDDAGAQLQQRFKLSEIQANEILQMRLQRLTALDVHKLEEEYRELMKHIEEYNFILANDPAVDDIIREDMYELIEKYGDDRRTEIVGDAEDLQIEDLIPEEDVVVTLTHDGYCKRMPISAYKKQKRGGVGVIGMETKETDFVESLYVASSHDYMMIFSNKGKVFLIKVYEIPHLGRAAKGRAIVNMVEFEQGEKLSAVVPVKGFDRHCLFMATRTGTVKKTMLAEYGNIRKGGIWGIKLEGDDELIGVGITAGTDEVMLATKAGQAIRFKEEDVRPMGRHTTGVTGIKLDKGDEVVSMIIVRPNGTILTVCENGFGKRTAFDEYPLQHRGGKGVISIRTSDRNGSVIGALAVIEGQDLMATSKNGQVIRMGMSGISIIGRATQGVRIVRLREDDKVVSIAPIAEDDGDSAGGAPAEDSPADEQA
ncbi:MAG: DNA gyrase subunit A [Planctomycetota bacterium]